MSSLRLLCAMIVLVPGCVGGGDGWAAGDLTLSQCQEASGLDKKGDFDLGIDFFAAEVLQDPNPATSEQRNRITIRLQNASTTIEVSDGLMFQFLDTERAARRFVAGQLVPVTDRSLCATGCPTAEDLVRGRLYLYTTCPDARQALIATNRSLTPATSPSGQSCQVPASDETASPCPDLDGATRSSLEALCGGNFNNRDGAALLRTTLGQGGSSCIYLCQFGSAKAGQDPASLAGFSVSYGDTVAALFSLRILDGRAIRSAVCSESLGQIQGMFKFKVQRGLAAQTFP